MMKKIIIFIVVIVVLGTAGYFVFHKSTDIQNNDKDMVGDDRDEHGCIGSAGYTWCEEKQKCLRVWEETCSAVNIEIAEKLKIILADKHDKDIADVIVNISQSDDTHAVGNVFFLMDGQQGEGGGVLAIKENGEWKVIYDGNGSVDCELLKNTYMFTNDLLVGYCD